MRLKVLVKYYKNIGKYFQDPRLKTASFLQDMYVGFSPFEALAIFSEKHALTR
jgi:hypothetical protein